MSNTRPICAASSAALAALLLAGCTVMGPEDRAMEACRAGDEASCEVLERRAELPDTMPAPMSSAVPVIWPSAGVAVGSGGRVGGGVGIGIGAYPFGDPWRDPWRRYDRW